MISSNDPIGLVNKKTCDLPYQYQEKVKFIIYSVPAITVGKTDLEF